MFCCEEIKIDPNLYAWVSREKKLVNLSNSPPVYAGPSTLIDVTVAMKQRWKRRSGSGGWLSQSSLPLRKCFLKPWGPAGALVWLSPGPCGLDVEPGRQRIHSGTFVHVLVMVIFKGWLWYESIGRRWAKLSMVLPNSSYQQHCLAGNKFTGIQWPIIFQCNIRKIILGSH